MNLQESVDWNKIRDHLLGKAAEHIPWGQNRADVNGMIFNIDSRITELSKAEVEARQGHPARAIELLNKVNQDIELVEEFLLMAALLG